MHPIPPEHAATELEIRVRFCETDLMGIVHHGNYLAYFEAGRVEWLRRRGVTYAEWAAFGVHFAVVEANLRYLAPARFDDLLVVETRLAQLRSVSMRFAYRLVRGGVLVAEGETRLAAVDGQHKLTRIDPAMIVRLLSPEIG